MTEVTALVAGVVTLFGLIVALSVSITGYFKGRSLIKKA